MEGDERMDRPARWKRKLPVFLLAAAVLGLWVALDLPCPIRRLTGHICPGCGMSRAWLALLRLDIAGAFRAHPMFWTVPAAGLLVWFDGELFPKRSQNTAFALLLAALVLGCYVLRLTAELMGHSVI